MVAGMWWFFTLIMISSYTANLAGIYTIYHSHFLHVHIFSLPHILQNGLSNQLCRGSCETNQDQVRDLLLRLN